MEQENKYYCPGAEELFIGYECEKREQWLGGDAHWTPTILPVKEIETETGIVYEVLDIGDTLRTQYLTKEQIETEGWANDGYDSDGCTKFDKQVGNEYYLIYYADWDEDHQILITWWTDKGRTSKGIMFQGECKSINEFRKLCKWLGINGTAK